MPNSLGPHGLYPAKLPCSWNSPSQNTGVGSFSLLQGIFPNQGLNPGLQRCRQILCQLSHKGSPRILEWATYPFSSGSFWPRNWTRISSTASRFFSNWAIRVVLWGKGQLVSIDWLPLILPPSVLQWVASLPSKYANRNLDFSLSSPFPSLFILVNVSLVQFLSSLAVNCYMLSLPSSWHFYCSLV